METEIDFGEFFVVVVVVFINKIAGKIFFSGKFLVHYVCMELCYYYYMETKLSLLTYRWQHNINVIY